MRPAPKQVEQWRLWALRFQIGFCWCGYAAETLVICTATISSRALAVYHVPNCLWKMQPTSSMTFKIVQVCCPKLSKVNSHTFGLPVYVRP